MTAGHLLANYWLVSQRHEDWCSWLIHIYSSRVHQFYTVARSILCGTTASIAPLIPMWIELIKSSRVLRFNQHRACGTGVMLPGPQFTKRTAVLTLNALGLERWDCDFYCVNFKHNLGIDIWSIQANTACDECQMMSLMVSEHLFR